MPSPHLIVEYRASATAFRREIVPADQLRRVGRTTLADIVVPFDDSMSQVHWELTWDGARCEVRDAKGAGGTFLGGRPIDRVEAESGAWVRSGRTDFRLYVEDLEPAPMADIPRELVPARDDGELFALLDAARSERIVPMLRHAIDEYDSLYDGVTRDTMEDHAPYLVRFCEGSSLLPRLTAGGWGNAWGIYGRSAAKWSELRAHFRRLLVVTRESDGLPMYFRFYDPRVFRVFLPISTPRQRASFFGPVGQFMVEGPDGKARVFDVDGEHR
jgi:hypothetical protein